MTTPFNGPWMRTCTAADDVYIVSDADRQLIGTIRGYERANLAAGAPALLEALEALFASYKELADSGDAGNWSLEDQPEGKQALAAIASAKGAGES